MQTRTHTYKHTCRPTPWKLFTMPPRGWSIILSQSHIDFFTDKVVFFAFRTWRIYFYVGDNITLQAWTTATV